MKYLARLRRDERGASAVEAAFALPVLLLFVFGTAQLGAILAANAGMQHALGEGARMATLFPQPTDDAIKAKVDDSEFGILIGQINDSTISTPATSVCTRCRDLQVTYTVTPNFVAYTLPEITITRNKRIYTSTS